MSQNIFALLQTLLNENLLSKIAGLLGENKAGVTSAVGSALPSMLLGLMQKGSEPNGAAALIKMLQEGKHDGGILDNLGNVLGGGNASKDFISSGKNVFGSLFGDKAGGITDLIASASGISKNAISSLLGILAPIVMGFLGKTLKAQGSLNPAGLTNLLLGQKDFIKSALPSGLTQLMGVTNLDSLGRQTVQAAQAAAGPAKKVWPWIALIIAAVVVFFLWRSCSTQEVAQKAAETAKQATTAAQSAADKAADAAKQAADKTAEVAKQATTAVQDTAGKVADQARDAWAALGKFFSKKLPSGVELNIPEFGVENKLIAFIENAQLPVDDKTWFSFDRLTFETGKATLKPESQEQLKNIAEILKAYPKVTIKLGGYTDNTGDPQANLKLSQQRADAVMADLVKLGVDAGRMKAEGYGQEHPVADNSTEEGRAKNRRIDIRVTGK
jgi:outer membrane protein OmpA-like peptidoglycan-associated protein